MSSIILLFKIILSCEFFTGYAADFLGPIFDINQTGQVVAGKLSK